MNPEDFEAAFVTLVERGLVRVLSITETDIECEVTPEGKFALAYTQWKNA